MEFLTPFSFAGEVKNVGELQKSNDGLAFLSITINNQYQQAKFFKLMCFGGLAEKIDETIEEGDVVGGSGKISCRAGVSSTTGEPYYRANIICQSLELLEDDDDEEEVEEEDEEVVEDDDDEDEIVEDDEEVEEPVKKVKKTKKVKKIKKTKKVKKVRKKRKKADPTSVHDAPF